MTSLRRVIDAVTVENAVAAACITIGLTLLASGASRLSERLIANREIVAARALVSPIRFGTVLDELRAIRPNPHSDARGFVWLNLDALNASPEGRVAVCDALRSSASDSPAGPRVVVSGALSLEEVCGVGQSRSTSGLASWEAERVPTPAIAAETAWAVVDSAYRVLYSVHADGERSTTRTLRQVIVQIACGNNQVCGMAP